MSLCLDAQVPRPRSVNRLALSAKPSCSTSAGRRFQLLRNALVLTWRSRRGDVRCPGRLPATVVGGDPLSGLSGHRLPAPRSPDQGASPMIARAPDLVGFHHFPSSSSHINADACIVAFATSDTKTKAPRGRLVASIWRTWRDAGWSTAHSVPAGADIPGLAVLTEWRQA